VERVLFALAANRAMDLIIEADATAKVQKATFFCVANPLNLQVDVLRFDTTSTYFETGPDVDPDGQPGFRPYGHSKDHRRTCHSSSSDWG